MIVKSKFSLEVLLNDICEVIEGTIIHTNVHLKTYFFEASLNNEPHVVKDGIILKFRAV